ncbi:hypothetical protein MBLNU13_g03719t1 [Cladosporium sp. NU13]
MTDTSRSVKRAKHDFSSTFDVLSKFLAAARKSEWLREDSSKPVDLSDEDPDVFQDYLNCVYGPDILGGSRKAIEREALDSIGGINDIVVDKLHKEITNEHLTAQFESFGEIKEYTISDDNFYSTASINFATS